MLAADAIHKTDPDFKLIYGCEAYFVDDMIPCVYGVKDEPLNGEFCVFDTETTGLDPGVEHLTEIGCANQMGLKNLYKIVSEAHVNYFFKKPRVPQPSEQVSGRPYPHFCL